MIYRFVHNRIDLVLGDVSDFPGAAVQQRFQLRDYGGFIFRRASLLWGNGYNTDFFISAYRATENLLNGDLKRLLHLIGFLDGDVSAPNAPSS